MPEGGPREGAPKKSMLTLAQLASYDDLITDILVDRVYFWSMIRKNRARYSACRGMKEEDIPNILRDNIVEKSDCESACRELLQLNGIRKAYERLRSSDEKEHFRDHLMRYLESFLPDCPWEVYTTNRYTIETHEAAVCARRFIPRGEQVKYLVGIQVPITPEEEETLDLTRRDFSIVKSSRKKTSSLFLGPARFANHDCDANARLTTKGSNGMAVIATKDINVGDEITVSYGTHFFGPDNCECLCATCEKKGVHGWNPADARSDDSDESDAESGRGRSASNSVANSRSQSRTSTAADSARSTPSQSQTPSPTKKRRLESSTSPSKRAALGRLSTIKMERTPSALSQEVRPEEIPESRSQGPSGAPAKPGQRYSPSSADESQYSTEATSWSDREKGMSTRNSNHSRNTNGVSQGHQGNRRATGAEEVEAASARLLNGHMTQQSGSSSDSGPSSSRSSLSHRDSGHVRHIPELTIEYASSQASIEGPAGSPERDYLNARDNKHTTSTNKSPHEQGRRPGDYELTRRLLCQPGARWVECRVCDCFFVQHDAMQTRQQCPRCERHAKIYGYRWPKTQKAHRNDPEERIKDHREIHPYVFADEERQIRKGRSSHLLELLQEKESSTSSPHAASDDEGENARPTRHASKRKIDYYQPPPVEEEWETDRETSQVRTKKRPEVDRRSPSPIKDANKRTYTRTGFWTREAKQQRKADREERRRRKELSGSRTIGKGRSKAPRPRLRPDGTPKRQYTKSGKYVGRAAKRIEQKAMQLAAADGRREKVRMPESQRAVARVEELAEQYRQDRSFKRKYIKSGKFSKTARQPGRPPLNRVAEAAAPAIVAESSSSKPSKPSHETSTTEKNGKKYIKAPWKGYFYELNEDEDQEDQVMMDVDVNEERRTRSGRVVSQSVDRSERGRTARTTEESEDEWVDESEHEQPPRVRQNRIGRRRTLVVDSDDESDDDHDSDEIHDTSPERSTERGSSGKPQSKIVRLRTGRVPRKTAKAQEFLAESIEDSGDAAESSEFSEDQDAPTRGRQILRNPGRRVIASEDADEIEEPHQQRAQSKRWSNRKSAAASRQAKSETPVKADPDRSEPASVPPRKRLPGRPRKDSAATASGKTSSAPRPPSVRRSKRTREVAQDDDDDDAPAKMTRSSFKKLASEPKRESDKPPAKKVVKTKWKGWVVEVSDNEQQAEDAEDVQSGPPASATRSSQAQRDGPRTVAKSNATQLYIETSSTGSRASGSPQQQAQRTLVDRGRSFGDSEIGDSHYITSPRTTPGHQTGAQLLDISQRSTPQATLAGADDGQGQSGPGKLRRPSKWRNSIGPGPEVGPVIMKRPTFGNHLNATTKSRVMEARRSFTYVPSRCMDDSE